MDSWAGRYDSSLRGLVESSDGGLERWWNDPVEDYPGSSAKNHQGRLDENNRDLLIECQGWANDLVEEISNALARNDQDGPGDCGQDEVIESEVLGSWFLDAEDEEEVEEDVEQTAEGSWLLDS